MLKYLYVQETFSEVPNMVSLCIELSGCTIRCPKCHSKELWTDKGTILNIDTITELINKHKGIDCVCILGGENFEELNTLFEFVKSKGLYTCWYTGLDKIPKGINLCYLDFIKVGPFIEYPINDKRTNQKMIKVSVDSMNGKILRFKELKDITHEFWNNTNES